MNNYHVSVLLQDVLDYLNPKSGGVYIDATMGGGGHTFEILKHGGKVLALDQDQDAIEYVEQTFEVRSSEFEFKQRLVIVHGNFSDIGEIAKSHGFTQVDGILFDLGISSHHVDEGARGFSFLKDGPLDMRMNQESQVTAADLINGLTEHELADLFSKYGEEPFARRIAKAIVQDRQEQPILRTVELAELIRKTVRGKSKVHPATKVFQALRIAVNDELHRISIALTQAVELLRPGGRLVVIAFHSLEDRIVKQTFSEYEKKGVGKLVLKKPIIPSVQEQEVNNRSRSAKLRVLEII
jgi:16S rRNA (cytosine1402-N4)-methyltransferase